jgi:chromosome segregation ATPase
MQDPATVLSSGETWADDFAHALDQQRSRAEQFLAGQRQRLLQAQAELTGQVQRIAAELDLTRNRSDRGRQENDQRGEEIDRLLDHLCRLRVELESRQAAWEQTCNQAVDRDQASVPQADTDFLRRYEKAIEEARGLRSRVEDLEQQLARRQTPVERPCSPPGEVLDWEVEKRRILARLEAESSDETDEDSDPQRLDIRELVEKTDRIIAEKQAEIASLQQVLRSQTSNLGSVAVGAAAVGQLLDNDAVVCEERENLRRLKQQWEQRMRESEIETSIARASIARQRAELEDRIKAFESRQSAAPSPSASATGRPDKPVRGRWLARLGLKEPEE